MDGGGGGVGAGWGWGSRAVARVSVCVRGEGPRRGREGGGRGSKGRAERPSDRPGLWVCSMLLIGVTQGSRSGQELQTCDQESDNRWHL